MALLRSHKVKVVLGALATGALLAWFAAREAPRSPDVPKDIPDKPSVTPALKPEPAKSAAAKFDFYLLALTVHEAFCADGHRREPECRARAQWPLVIHGLWPENLKPRTYPHDCPAPPLSLDPALALELEPFMPGMADGLHEHEWREHGGCSGLDDDVYFRHTLDLARDLVAALAARLTTLAGQEAAPGALREIAEIFRPGTGKTFTLHCRTPRGRDRPVLMEVRQCIDNDGPGGAPGTLLDCASVGRRDQGCGESFLVLERRR